MNLNNVIPIKAGVPPSPLTIGVPMNKTIYVKRVSAKQIKRLMELGFTVVLR